MAISMVTLALIALLVIGFMKGFLSTILAAMCGTVIGFIGTLAAIFFDIIGAIETAARAFQ